MTARLIDPKDAKGEYPFSYRPSYATDLKATFAKWREQQQKDNVRQMRRKSK